MSRHLLHKSKLEAFKAWLDKKGIEHRPGRGDYQVMQVELPNGQWGVVYDRLVAPEHYTVTSPLEPLTRRFIQAHKDIVYYERKKQNDRDVSNRV